jgi:hypothetical protein
MAYSTLPISGVNLNDTTNTSFAYTNGSTAVAIPAFGPLGTQTFGNDGKRYVFGRAGAAIAASATNCIVNASTFVVTTGTAGTYAGPTATSVASGEFAWFAATSV